MRKKHEKRAAKQCGHVVTDPKETTHMWGIAVKSQGPAWKGKSKNKAWVVIAQNALVKFDWVKKKGARQFQLDETFVNKFLLWDVDLTKTVWRLADV